MRIFVDGGAHRGESVRFFRARFPDAADYHIVAYEPNVDLHADLAGLTALDPPVEIRGEALWVVDGSMPFYPATHSQAGTLIGAKTTFRLGAPRPVPCCAFPRWLAAVVRQGFHLVVKLDIEGAEYDVLESCDDATLQGVAVLYVDWHGWKIEGFDPRRHDALVERLQHLGHPPLRWEPHHDVLDLPHPDRLDPRRLDDPP